MSRHFMFENRPVWYTHDSKGRAYFFRRQMGMIGAVSRFRAAEKRMETVVVIYPRILEIQVC